MNNLIKVAGKFETAENAVALKDQPIVVGLWVMAKGMCPFIWFGAGIASALMVSSQVGWFAALYFVMFVAFIAYGVKCLKALGQKAIDDRKKG